MNTSVYNNHMFIYYNKYNKIGQYELFSVIKYNKDKNKNKIKNKYSGELEAIRDTF